MKNREVWVRSTEFSDGFYKRIAEAVASWGNAVPDARLFPSESWVYEQEMRAQVEKILESLEVNQDDKKIFRLFLAGEDYQGILEALNKDKQEKISDINIQEKIRRIALNIVRVLAESRKKKF